MSDIVKFSSIVLLLACFSLPGCSKSGIPGLVPVHGTVFFEGAPLEEATIAFKPAEGTEGARMAIAKTDEQGKFQLMTLNPGDGIKPGTYTVTVTKIIVDVEKAKRVPEHEAQPVIHLVPERYTSYQTSGIELTIGPKGDKNIEIRLEK